MTDEEELRDATSHIGIVSIIDAVCEVWGVTRDEIMCSNRSMRLSRPRFAVYYLSWLYTKRSLANIGRFMGRDHTTIMYGRDKCITLRRENPTYSEHVEEAKERAFEIELRKELAAQKELALVQRALEREKEIETRTQRKLEEARKALSKKGVIRGDQIIFPRIDSHG